MLFSSLTFLYIFLPLTLLLYYISGKKFRNYVLLLASIIFYGWAEPKYLIIMLSIILISYAGALIITAKDRYRKILLFLTVIFNLSFLFYYKYFNFICTNISDIFSLNCTVKDVLLPVGISFYTFQALSYVFDVYRKITKPEKNLLNLALYICLFPQLVAGPIIKYHDISNQIQNRDFDFDKFVTGIKRFIIGLSKKAIIANSVGLIADKIFIQDATSISSGIAWIGSIAYTLQIYYDFSGYSDMAIGLGLMFGFTFCENFNYPYISKSITEFWRRWHMSLSNWFKEYLYIPLGGNKQGLFKTCRNLGIVFLITGIWHGASWSFILWGLWHGFFIILEKIFKLESKSNKNFIISAIMYIYTMSVVIIGWVVFRCDSLEKAFLHLSNMFGILKTNQHEYLFKMSYYLDKTDMIIIIAAIICMFPIFKNILQKKNWVQNLFINCWLIFLFILSSMYIACSTYNPFIYFRF